MLFGELIQDIREAVTDQPQSLPAPIALLTVGSFPGSTIPSGNYFCVLTYRNQYGETLPSAEAFLTIGPGQGVNIQATIPPNLVAVRLYLTLANGASGSEIQFTDFTINPAPGPVNFTIGLQPTGAGGPPTRSSAYLPDTDGDAVSAGTIFRWINRGLEVCSNIAGGLVDFSGIGSTSGVAQYQASGEWKRISSLWYDGYPLAMDDSGNYFRRNPITASVLASVSLYTLNNQMLIELWPQPARTSAITNLNAPLTPTGTSMSVVSAGGFLLQNGMVAVSGEIMSYNGIVGNTLQNLQRALGGTVANSFLGTEQVQELNIFWQGWRVYSPNFQPGQSNLVVPIPTSWNAAMYKYGLGRMKLAEQNVGDHQKLEQDLIKFVSDWMRQNKVVVGPRQVGEVTNSLEVWPSFGGGFVVP